MNKIINTLLLVLLCCYSYAQENPFIKLVELTKEKNTVTAARQFIIGSTCKTCSVKINDIPVKVYSTGAFAYEVNLKPVDTVFIITASNAMCAVSDVCDTKMLGDNTQKMYKKN